MKAESVAHQQKIDFLIRYGPGLRDLKEKQSIDSLDNIFFKKVYKKGIQIVRQKEMNDYLYIIFQGKCKIMINTNNEECAKIFPEEAKFKFKYVTLGNLHKGQTFGEHSIINGVESPFTIEVCSESVIVF